MFTAMHNGQPVHGGQWNVLGGTNNGSIDANGTFHAPASVPNPNIVSVAFTTDSQTFTGTVSIDNPVPTITSISPSSLTKLTTSIQITGSGFVPDSLVTANSISVPTTFIDSTHLSVVITLPNPTSTTLQIGVSNPDSGGTGGTIALQALFPTINIQPATLSGGPVTLSISGSNFSAGDVVFLGGKPLITTLNSSTLITATGYLAPWTQGNVMVEITSGDGVTPIANQSVPIAPTAVTYDAAARFTTQAAFGPNPTLVEHVQKIGFDAFITEQFQLAPVSFISDAPHTYISAATSSANQGNSLLRQRVALALQSFIVPQGQAVDSSSTFFEDKLEADASANFRQLLDDISLDLNIAHLLNLAGNNASTDPLYQPNQNFARELMQLFSIGPFLLNDDGTLQLDAKKNPIPTYDQNTVIDMTRALTGWNYPNPVNPQYTAWGEDFSQPLVGIDSNHDHGAKLLFGSVILPAGQSIDADRAAVLNAIFNHPNLPPFISHLLIQHLVKSNPSPAYIQRISSAFEDDGRGTRGNMAAVVRAILLDPEARSGDATPSPSDGFLQEPVLFELFAMNIMQSYGTDDQPNYVPKSLGETLWNAPTVFGFMSPSYSIPGTSINSPEFGLFNNISALQRSDVLWGMVTGQLGGFSSSYTQTSWLFTHFTTVPDMVEALNHLAYHGQMPQQLKTNIINYCSQLNRFDIDLQLESALFLALNADSYNVAH
ncbi:DUF1800 family protein [Edaphobacter bradus]|uniref:DUF1800 family protein n=1 Tax=Edaphobacter bradus TaxID=2259016 RepID=UPI0021DFCD05|nr:DUF1800 family protein [Edaphobacter bradus]